MFLQTSTTNYYITLYKDGAEIGRLDFNGHELVFTGDAEDSAKVFIDFVATSFKQRLADECAAEREACAKVCDELVNADNSGDYSNAANWCAIRIRSRGNA